jgi:branched-chain amino acid transport system ATP-binding protein
VSAVASLLAVENLHVRYGGVAAVRGLSLSVAPGEMVSIIGPNGAGKSTTLAAIAGGVAVESGRISFAGRDVTGRRPEDIARLGVSLVPEGRHVFATLSVDENLAIGTYMRRDRAAVATEIAEVFKLFPQLLERRRAPAGKLSGGEQQMLVIGRALLAAPRLIMVDEPSLGLAPRIVDKVYGILLELRRRQGMTLLIVEQSSHRILKHADRIYVIRDGRVQLEDVAANLHDGEAIKRAYFGFGGPPAGPAAASRRAEAEVGR